MRAPTRIGRVVLPLVFALLAAPASSQAAAPIVRTIAGTRLTVNIGDDTSLQVWDSTVGDVALFEPSYADATQTGDAGTLVALGGSVYGPDFANHPVGSYAPPVIPWTPVSISPVTGSGTLADPFTVVVVVDAASTGLRLTETVTYVDGTGRFLPTFAFSNSGPAALTWQTFLAADMYLGVQYVWPILLYGAPGGWAAEKLGAPTPACAPHRYYALLPAADRYTGHVPLAMWSEIASGGLSSTMDSGCSFSGIATEWADRTLGPGQMLTIGPAPVSFVNASPFVNASIPAVSAAGLFLAFLGLALAGGLIART